MTYTAEETGTPGSPLAVNNGCTCAVLDNHRGQGFRWSSDGPQNFWISGDCPLHAIEPVDAALCAADPPEPPDSED